MVYVGFVCVCGFWFLLGLSLVGLSHQLVIWGSVCPPPLVFCCAGVGRLCWSWFFHGFEAFLLLLFSCLFWVISSLFSCISRYVLGWVSVTSTPSFTFCCYLLVVPLLVGFPFQKVYWCLQHPPTVFLIIWRGKVKWFITAGMYSMVFKVPTHGVDI